AAAGPQLQPPVPTPHPAAQPLHLVLVAAGVPQPGPGLDVVEPDVLHAGAVGPRLLAGHRAGVAPDALVEVHDHGQLRHDLHVPPPVCGGPGSVLDRGGAPADLGDLVPVVPGRADVVEEVGQLGVAADDVARLDEDPGQAVVDAAPLAVGLGERDVDEAVLGVVHVDGALGHPVADDRPGRHDPVAVDGLDPVVVADADLGGVDVADPDH